MSSIKTVLATLFFLGLGIFCTHQDQQEINERRAMAAALAEAEIADSWADARDGDFVRIVVRIHGEQQFCLNPGNPATCTSGTAAHFSKYRLGYEHAECFRMPWKNEKLSGQICAFFMRLGAKSRWTPKGTHYDRIDVLEVQAPATISERTLGAYLVNIEPTYPTTRSSKSRNDRLTPIGTTRRDLRVVRAGAHTLIGQRVGQSLMPVPTDALGNEWPTVFSAPGDASVADIAQSYDAWVGAYEPKWHVPGVPTRALYIAVFVAFGVAVYLLQTFDPDSRMPRSELFLWCTPIYWGVIVVGLAVLI